MKQIIAFDGVSLRDLRINGVLVCSFSQPCFVRDGKVCSFKVGTFAELFEFRGVYYLYTFITSHRLRVFSDYNDARNCFVEFVSLVG